MENFSSKEEIPKTQDKPLKKPQKEIQEDIEDKRRSQPQKEIKGDSITINKRLYNFIFTSQQISSHQVTTPPIRALFSKPPFTSDKYVNYHGSNNDEIYIPMLCCSIHC
jgi:hypothetical protein